MAQQAKTWVESRKTTRPWGCKWKVLVPKSSFLPFYLLEERVQPEIIIGIMQISFWLHGWGCFESFGFHENRTFCDDYCLLGRDGIHLSRRGKGIFGSRLATLWRWALNWLRGWGPKCRCSRYCRQLGNKPGQPEQWKMFLSCVPRG